MVRTAFVAALVGSIVIAGVVGAVLTGVGPAPGGSAGAETPSVTFTDTVVVGDDGSDGSTEATGAAGTTTTAPPFGFVIDSIANCGDTCRDVTVTLTNNQADAATGVVVRTEIYTDGERIWRGREDVGSLGAGESVTRTARVKLSLTEAYAVKQNDGVITIKTFVETDSGTYVFERQRDVIE